ncbi:serine/threonine-protein kinase [Nannocystis bainbridge]|uniref:non-specific serine/threonine protein kinase n=1 Tax=Nannocystis bainbridge TaxID=2995303 RepID=A0ABT5ECL5_9BACT|nr:serine/threonine-protein kinase [Nannocystis bainbridge]MDC0722643.1 serine/threonine-protein kinase [Nannocystis bainbridge]
MAETAPPQGLQRYQIMEPLGAGSQGRTFRAIDRETGAAVAVKVLHLRSLGGDWKPFDLFERECQALESLSHPGIPRYVDRYTSDTTGDFFLVMELVEGAPLSQRLGRAGDPAELQRWLTAVLDILEYLHGRHPPVIHRDIKPSNLILRPDGHLVLIDFGGVRLAVRPDGGSTMIGTFGYMAPEQLHGEATPATDIYALGATIAALAAGMPADQLPRKGLQIDLERCVAPGRLRDVLSAMLEPDPTRRLASSAAVRAALGTSARPRQASEPRRASAQTQASSQAMEQAPMPDYPALRSLPKFLRVFVWLWAWLATGLFFVIEFVFVPMVFALQASSRRYKKKAHRMRRLRAREADALSSVQRIRRRLQAIADNSDPRDQAALPEGRDR